MAYTTNTAVKALIGTVYSTTDLTDAQITAHIARADGIIDAAVADLFTVPFNASTDTPATPKVIAQASEYLAAAYCFRQLHIKGSNSALGEQADNWAAEADGLIEGLRNVPGQMRPETVSTETITLTGSSRQSWEPNQYEAFIGDGSSNPMTAHQSSYQPPNILEESVRILSTSASTGYTGAELAKLRNGVDFTVRFNSDWKKYVFEAHESALQNATTINITYLWDYRRKYGESRRIHSMLLEA